LDCASAVKQLKVFKDTYLHTVNFMLYIFPGIWTFSYFLSILVYLFQCVPLATSAVVVAILCHVSFVCVCQDFAFNQWLVYSDVVHVVCDRQLGCCVSSAGYD
jgi:hypothetical protein